LLLVMLSTRHYVVGHFVIFSEVILSVRHWAFY
jgi:hypothetical protein